MRNLGASPYLENPELVEIKAVPAPDKSGNRVNQFNMNISIKRAQPEDPRAVPGRGAPAKAAGAKK
jgi:type IV pilus assembly protein PilN